MNNIIQVSKDNLGIEHQGTKQKFWFGENQDRLFKIGKHNGENWAEIVAFHLATLLEIPCAEYVPGNFDNKKGVISTSFINKNAGDRLIHANELLAKLVKDYDEDTKYKQRKYTFFVSMSLIKLLSNRLITNKYDPIQQFIGYLIFDIWIGNQDRHHENWGFVANGNNVINDKWLYLAPSFDHASSMGCRIGQDEKQQRLVTIDKGYCVESFAKKAKTAMYNKSKLLKTYDLAKLCYKHYPDECSFWIDKINNIMEEQIKKCFNLLPLNWMSDIDEQFTLKLLQSNQQFLQKLCVSN